MNKSLAILLCAFSYAAYSQNIEIGGRGTIGSFWLMNSATSAAGNPENKTFSISYGGGLHLAYDFTDHAGIEANVVYGVLSQSYSGNYNSTGILPDGTGYISGESYTSKSTLTAIQLPLVLCLENDMGSFVEVGLEYDMIQGATYSANYTNPSGNRSFDASGIFSNNNIMGVLGFGGKYSIANNLFILTDFRIQYGFTDIKGVDGAGQSYNSSPYYSSYSPTHALYGSVNIGLFYMLCITSTHSQGHQRCTRKPKVRD